MPMLFLTDVTLRDGSHAIKHQYDLSHVRDIAMALDEAGVDAIEIGHGNGTSGSSLTNGFARHTNLECFREAAKVLRRARIATILIPGIGTTDDLRQAVDAGVSMVRVATHCTEADLSEQHIAAARSLGLHTSRFLMMSSATSPEQIAEQSKKMESYGAQCIYVADYAGSMTMADVRARFLAMDAALDANTERGIHAHENLSLAVANSIEAVERDALRSRYSNAACRTRPASHGRWPGGHDRRCCSRSCKRGVRNNEPV